MKSEHPTVGLDLRALDPNFKAHFGRGTGRYVSELTKRLLQRRIHGLSLVPLTYEKLALSEGEKKFIASVPFGKITIETQLLLPQKYQSLNIDLFHFFAHFDAPSFYSRPYVVTVLDLIPLIFADLYKAKGNLRFKFARFLENRALCNAKAIIAISEATKKDIIRIFNYPAEKIFVTPLGVDEKFFFEISSVEELLQKKKVAREGFSFPQNGKLLLYVGGIDARKNVPFLLDCLQELLRDSKDCYLVLAGNYAKDDNYPALVQKIKMLGLEKHVVLPGFVPEEKLIDLYLAADLFLFPSLYEGFGLPVVEAMSCRLPVLVGRNSSMFEVLPSSEYMLPDNNLDAWVRAIKRELTHDATKSVFDNAQFAKRFSWDMTADLTMKAYKEILEFT